MAAGMDHRLEPIILTHYGYVRMAIESFDEPHLGYVIEFAIEYDPPVEWEPWAQLDLFKQENTHEHG
jgi:hypothetical protein